MIRADHTGDPRSRSLIERGSWTHPVWEQIRARDRQLFGGAFAWVPRRFDLSSGGETRFVEGAFASAGIFDVLGVRPVLGRTFIPADDARGGGPEGPVAVISYGFWQRHFGGAPDVLGRSLTLSRVPGVERAALSVKTPGGDGGWNAIVDAPGDATVPERQRLTWVNAVTPGWFDAYGMRVLAGRNVEEGEHGRTSAGDGRQRGVRPEVLRR